MRVRVFIPRWAEERVSVFLLSITPRLCLLAMKGHLFRGQTRGQSNKLGSMSCGSVAPFGPMNRRKDSTLCIAHVERYDCRNTVENGSEDHFTLFVMFLQEIQIFQKNLPCLTDA